jgi:hypothetical protein
MGVLTCLIEKWPTAYRERSLKMKIWKVPVLIGTSDEYSQVQADGLEDWFREFEERFAHDFSYIRLKFGKPVYIERAKLNATEDYPNDVQEWQAEADSELKKIIRRYGDIQIDEEWEIGDVPDSLSERLAKGTKEK